MNVYYGDNAVRAFCQFLLSNVLVLFTLVHSYTNSGTARSMYNMYGCIIFLVDHTILS